MAGRITQEFLESTDTGNAKARVTEVFLESVDQSDIAKARVTQLFIEYIDREGLDAGPNSGMLTFVG